MWEAHLSADPGAVPFLGLRKNYGENSDKPQRVERTMFGSIFKPK
jgi:hypothetical protein